ncbi:hypothetical protein Dimus_014190 [Dionaea muscipula]
MSSNVFPYSFVTDDTEVEMGREGDGIYSIPRLPPPPPTPPSLSTPRARRVMMRSILKGDVTGFLEASRDFGLMEFRGLGGDTVLHIAARAGQLELITRILRECNKLITTKNANGELPLHVAARAGELDSVKYLVDWIVHYKEHRGAGRRGEGGPNQDGTNQNQEEQDEIRIEMCPFCRSDNDTAPSPGGTNENQEEQSEIRIEMDMVARVNWFGNTALHIALENHNEEMAAYLVDKYPSASYYANYLKVSPLYLAIEGGYSELVQSMFARKSIEDEDVKNRLLQGKSVVHAAIMARNSGIIL